MIGFLLVVALVVFFFWRRARRARRLAGLTAAAPVFSVEPPHRRIGNLRGERL